MSHKRAAHDALCRLFETGDGEALAHLAELADELEQARWSRLALCLLPGSQEERWAGRAFVVVPAVPRIIE